MAQKITHWLLIALILSLGFGQLLRFEYFGATFYLHDVIVLTLLLLQLKSLSKLTLPKSLKVLCVGLAFGWLRALTLYPASILLIPSLYTLRLLAYLTLYLLLKQSKILVPRVYFLISGLVSITIGLFQYFALPDMRVFQYLGWDDHLNRLVLPHFDPTFTAVMLSLFVLTLTPKIWYFGILTFISILLTYSRSVWLSLFVTLIYCTKSAKYIFLASVVGLIAILALPRGFGEGTNLLRTYSVASRIDGDLSYVQKYRWDLVLGRGMNTLSLDIEPGKYTNHASGPNNSYLYLLLTSGLAGLIGWGVFLRSLYRQSSHKPMLIFFCIASLFNNVMFYPFALLWVLLVEAMAPSATSSS